MIWRGVNGRKINRKSAVFFFLYQTNSRWKRKRNNRLR
jgi:hypothetical protein